VERRTEVDGAAGVADRDPARGDLPEIRHECRADVPLEAQPRSGLKEPGELVPKSHVLGLQKRVEELERALGRKALEVDVLKKAFELKGLKLPEGI
jgi:hypothetical protein